jgi:hypothetical protein
MGHRIYKVLDPRARRTLNALAQISLRQIGDATWIQMSERIAELMLKKKASTPTSISTPPRCITPSVSPRPFHSRIRHRSNQPAGLPTSSTARDNQPDSPPKRLPGPLD